jgi:hypothetical protein
LDFTNDLRSLGEAHVGDVVEQTLARAKQHGVDAASQRHTGVSAGAAVQITEVSTGAIARWLEGDRPAGAEELLRDAEIAMDERVNDRDPLFFGDLSVPIERGVPWPAG